MAQQQSIVVAQHYNPKFNSNHPKDGEANPEHLFEVVKTVNTMVVAIGDRLRPTRVQGLIDDGINVTIQPLK